MADGTQDRIDIALGADTSGLDAAERRTNAFIDNVAQTIASGNASLPPLDINTGLLAQSLRETGNDVNKFFADIKRLDQTGPVLNDLIESLAFSASKLKATSEEARALEQAIKELRAVQAQPVAQPIAPPVAGTLLGSQDDTRLAQSATRNAAALAEMNVQLDRAQGRFIQVARTTGDVASGSDKMAAGIARASTVTVAGATAFEGHARGAARATQAIANLAATSIGAEGPVARLAESALLFSGGEVAVVAVAGAVLGLGAAYTFVTTKEREVSEARDRMVQGLLQESGQAVPAAVRASEAMTAALEAQRKAREGLLTQAAQATGRVVSFLVDPGGAGLSIAAEVRRRNEEAQLSATKAITQAQRDQQRATQDFQTLNVQTITQSIALHTADNFQIRQAEGFVRELTVQEKDQNLPLMERIKLHQQLLQLQSSLRDDDLRNAQRAGALQAVQDDLSIAQQGFQSRDQQLKSAFQQDLLTRDQFYQRRRQQAVEAERADTAALQQRLSAVLAEPGQTPAAQQALDNQAASLREQITLRENLLRQQTQQIGNEEALSKLDVLLRSGIGFVNSAGTSIGNVSAPLIADFTFKLRPQVDLRETKAEIASLEKDFDRFNRENGLFGSTIIGAEQFNNTLAAISGNIPGLTSVAAAIGLIGEEGDRTIQALSGVLSGVSQIAHGDLLGGLIGIGGSIASAFGPTQIDRDLQAAQKENTQALRDATAAYAATQGRFAGAGGIVDQRAIVNQILNSPQGRNAIEESDSGVKFLRENAVDDLADAARAAGITLDELERIAKANGITLVVDNRLVGDSLLALQHRLDQTAQSATNFGDTLEDRRSILETEDKLHIGGRASDESVAGLQRTRELQLGALHLSDQEEARIRALDLTTAKGRADFLKFEQDLFQRALHGNLTPEELGVFKTVGELQQSINDAADGLNGFTDATAAATRNLLNVPDINTLAEQEFKARSPFGAGEGPSRLGGTDFNPKVPGVDFSRAGVVSPITVHGSIVINVQGVVDDPEATARAVRASFIRSNLSTTGREEE